MSPSIATATSSDAAVPSASASSRRDRRRSRPARGAADRASVPAPRPTRARPWMRPFHPVDGTRREVHPDAATCAARRARSPHRRLVATERRRRQVRAPLRRRPGSDKRSSASRERTMSTPRSPPHAPRNAAGRRCPRPSGRILYRLADLLVAARRRRRDHRRADNGTPVSTMRPGDYTAGWVALLRRLGRQARRRGRAGDGGGLDYVLPEPYGVIGAIVPWNGPMMGMGQKVAPALAAGNAVVAKPPEIAPFGVLRFAELALEAGLPPGVLNVVAGGADAGEALVRHPGVDKVSFTGGNATARASWPPPPSTLKPLALELGGKSANIVFPDADLDAAAPRRAARRRAAQRPGLRAAHPPVRARRRVRRGRGQVVAHGRGARGRRPARPDDARWARSCTSRPASGSSA